MGTEPAFSTTTRPTATPAWCLITVVGSLMLGLSLMTDQALRLSATYDEVTYLKIAAQWWRTGDQSSITQMGSPLTFWKLQQIPTLWLLDRVGLGSWVDDPTEHQSELLPIIRIGGFWTWAVALLIVSHWARKLYGPRAMALASALFALSPNILAHGALSTMELPILACTSGLFYGFWCFLKSAKRRDLIATAALGGLAMSCKFTTILIPPILAVIWAIKLWREPRLEGESRSFRSRVWRITRTVGGGMTLFVGVMVVANLVVTGFATTPLSSRKGSHPLLEGKLSPRVEHWGTRVFESSFPQDWVGFATQVVHQRNGGPSYLLGERRMSGWSYYYPVAMAVKLPLVLWFLVLARSCLKTRGRREDFEWVLPMIVGLFLMAAMLGSKRNYGFRYLLPLATPTIVWISALGESRGRFRYFAMAGLVGLAITLGSIHPHELAYFNELAGGPIGGRKILSDSNLDWGQGARSLARLQHSRPEFRDLTLFYFGETDPSHYGVEGRRIVLDANRVPANLPAKLQVDTAYLAVSASLQWGPWGPFGYFRVLDAIEPVCYTDDTTIAIYRTADLRRAEAGLLPATPVKTGRGPG